MLKPIDHINLHTFINTHSKEDVLRIFSELELKVNPVGDYEDVYIVDYCQIKSPRKHPIADACRGVILDLKNKIVLRNMFKRFYNYGEFPEMLECFTFDSTTTVAEKVDGSVIGLWFDPYTKQWQTGTRGTPFGNTDMMYTVNGEHKTYNQLFNEVVDLKKLAVHLSINHTYIFELCSKYNEVVVAHEKPKVVLLGMVNNRTSVVYAPNDLYLTKIGLFGAEAVKVYSFSDVNSVLKYVSSLSVDQEGVVVTDLHGNMMKIKSELYVLLHHTKTKSWNDEKILAVILAGEIDELLAVVNNEEVKYIANKLARGIAQLEADVMLHLDDVNNTELTQKEFALKVNMLKHSGILFSMRKGMTYQQALQKCGTKGLLNIINI